MSEQDFTALELHREANIEWFGEDYAPDYLEDTDPADENEDTDAS